MKKGELAHLCQPGARLQVRATPGARSNSIGLDPDSGKLLVRVTAPPDGGRANAAVQKLLARALGIAKSRLTLLRGDTSRDKLWQIDDA